MRLFLPLAVIVAGACAAPTGPRSAVPQVDIAEAREALGCPRDLAPVCVERSGQVSDCFCADRDALKRMLEPEKY